MIDRLIELLVSSFTPHSPHLGGREFLEGLNIYMTDYKFVAPLDRDCRVSKWNNLYSILGCFGIIFCSGIEME
jgi:hypothetical protein